jgi:hypothetical protein
LSDACLKWTNDELSQKGKSKISKEKFMAYVGLETSQQTPASVEKNALR